MNDKEEGSSFGQSEFAASDFLSELVGKRLVWPPDGECWGRRLGTELCMFLLLEQTFSAAKAIEKKRNWRRRRLDRIRCLGGC